VEALTDRIEAEAEAIFDRILELGGGEAMAHPIGPITAGLLRGIEDGWFSAEIAEAAFAYQTQLEKGDKRVVGVNCHTATVTGELQILRVSHEVETEQNRVLAQRRASRDQDAVSHALAELVRLAPTETNLIEPMLTAARVEATLGEICGALGSVWGGYTEVARF
jgi:methylmalonyl-CoA mutase N-terminal domain/subunit